MNAEELRRLSASELLHEVYRQVRLAQNLSGAFREFVSDGDPRLPLLTVGDFDIYPRGEPLPAQRSAIHFQRLVNELSLENGSDTPDWVLGEFLAQTLALWDRTIQARERWYGRAPVPVPADQCPQPRTPPEPQKP